MVVVLVAAVLWFLKPPRPAEKVHNSLPRYPYGSITEATDAFADTTVIGRGAAATVHRGTLREKDGRAIDGRAIAVKVSGGGTEQVARRFSSSDALLTLQRVRADINRRTDMFERAVRQLRNEVHHRSVRLVIPRMPRLLGMSESPQDKTPLLVFELAEGGDLGSSLSGRARSPRLLWRDRLRVMVDALMALWDLHTSDPKFLTLHRDFKSPNILLVQDKRGDYRGQLNDLGLATVLGGPQAQQVLEAGAAVPQSSAWGPHRVGTPAYQPYSLVVKAEHTISSEIHSVGVVLLEVLTGQLATDSGPPMLMERISRGDLRVEDVADAAADWPPGVDEQVLLLGRRCTSFGIAAEEQPQLLEVIATLTSLIEVAGNASCMLLCDVPDQDSILCEEGHRVCQDCLKRLVRTTAAENMHKACGAVYCPSRGQHAGDCQAPPYALSELYRLLDESTYILHVENMMYQMRVMTGMMARSRPGVSES
jgi:serine/threonine protein kinase